MPFQEKVVDFDGSNDNVSMGDVLNFDYNDPFSISFWVKTYKDGAQQYVISKFASSTPRGWVILINSSNELCFMIANTSVTDGIYVASEINPNDRTWHYICVTYDGSASASGVHMYDNGVESSGYTVAFDTLVSTTVNTEPFRLATTYALTLYLRGRLGEVAVYNKELSSAEIGWIYNGGLPRDLAGGGAPSNLVGWWRMGNGDTYPTLTDNSVNSNDGTMINMSSGDIVDDVIGGYSGSYISPLEVVKVDEITYDVAVTLGGTVSPIFFKMRAVDDGAPPPGFVTWIVTGEPDFAGVYFATGTPTPIGSMVPGSAILISTWGVE